MSKSPKTDLIKTDLIHGIDELLRHPFPRWLTVNAAAVYVGQGPSVFKDKIDKGLGPRFYRSPHSFHRVFHSNDLDDWVRNTPARERTPLQIERLRKLHEASRRGTATRLARSLERRRAKLEAQQAKPSPDEIEKLVPEEPASRRPRARRAAKLEEDVNV